MQELKLSLRFIKPMHKIGIEYLVTGSIAAVIYGEPRITHDIDIIVDLTTDFIEKFHDIYDEKRFYVPPVETLKIEAGRSSRGHFNLLDKESGFKADIYLKGQDKLHEWAFKKSVKGLIDSETVSIAPPEYVIVRKLIYYKEGRSEKHLEDIGNVIRTSREEIDFEEIEAKVKEFNLNEYWNIIKGK